ncbi:hypothetical protein SERLA73DRAFT_72899 [Serpula lacrymans var. lacrymans S7.3]|uniref:PPM-type phosphatase domain-containing protein n=2 Tax=Serpula lacrymans var. lacrymans TaxID=341189 RepID=F8PVF1_SERL3|nr:uncharacterized protein SERLADRAFT_437447 [Serpula lacrymans var. lacrymans S7.9]EGO00161.1 hypothetical protein SERLA73DRAFT_72899 [Serpula lacrymans var. lacrymans S7.3]EGO25722.1 hypothetical protein SERLADRAFT_437447 [Serpula lacrymans var. lacrymans S7.9]
MPPIIYNVVSLPAATSSDNLNALEEVKDFLTTDLGRGGSERWTYRLLPEHSLNSEIERISTPQSHRSVDSVTFQPCTTYTARSQDRYSIEEWDLPGGNWLFTAIYDGHCGHDTVTYAQRRLPSMVRMSLQALLKSASSSSLRPELVSRTLYDTIRHLDDSIRSDLFDLFPPDKLERMSDSQIKQHILNNGAAWAEISPMCTQGSTVLITLTDPSRKNLWVANLGDSQAVLGTRRSPGKWTPVVINASHNGNNPSERQRIMREHPGEPYSISEERVVGYLAPTRAVGDTWLKIPAAYSRRLFTKYCPEWMSPRQVHEFANRILTPPYVSDIPEVYHHTLNVSNPIEDYFLILCSDGLQDLYDGVDMHFNDRQMVDRWVKIVGQAIDSRETRNLALRLLRDGIGGDNVQLVSRNLTLEIEEKWMDDVTILIQRFR